MQLKTDHAFHIGQQHLRVGKPCQDYALSGKLNDDLAYAIVSDGCSSGGLTDIGSRLMVLATKQALEEAKKNELFPADQAELVSILEARNAHLASYRASLGLEFRDLLATCMWAVASSRQQCVFVHTQGDGVVALQYEDELMYEMLEWNNNMPYYPAYALADENDSFCAAHATSEEPFTHTLVGTSPGMGGIPDGMLSTHDVSSGMEGWSSIHCSSEEGYSPGALQSIALFSDGIRQIDAIDEIPAMKSLMAFKSTNGKFATRRMNRFLKDAEKVGRGPIDDIAYAVIMFDKGKGGPDDTD